MGPMEASAEWRAQKPLLQHVGSFCFGTREKKSAAKAAIHKTARTR
jgi:hypothetical protein